MKNECISILTRDKNLLEVKLLMISRFKQGHLIIIQEVVVQLLNPCVYIYIGVFALFRRLFLLVQLFVCIVSFCYCKTVNSTTGGLGGI